MINLAEEPPDLTRRGFSHLDICTFVGVVIFSGAGLSCVFSVQEYFSIPLSSLASVLGSAHVATVRLILQYYDRNRDTLQVGVLQQEIIRLLCFFWRY